MIRRPIFASRSRAAVAVVVLIAAMAPAGTASRPENHPGRPDILVITVDTLRADRVSGLGYDRPTTPNLDRLMARGVTFTQARTVEPLTGPALCSMMTGLEPHEHGASRNGLRMRPGLASLPKELRYHGYRTAAFVGSWTLRDKLSGLAEHFDHYKPVLTRKRWFGMVKGEATAADLNEAALDWLQDHRSGSDRKPVFLWVHYVEPHAPYRLWKDHADRLGIVVSQNVRARDRYDTEIAFVDAAIGGLLSDIESDSALHDPMIVFAADHGESLGEHDYWGHGRHLYEPTLRIPMSVTWRGHLAPSRIDAPSLIVDLAPTVLNALGMEVPAGLEGYDWTAAVVRGQPQPMGRVTRFQAHRGVVLSRHGSSTARRAGVLEVGLIDGDLKELYRLEKSTRRVFDLSVDPTESESISRPRAEPTEALTSWLQTVGYGLESGEDAPPQEIDDESLEKLRSLGYVD